MVVTDVYSFVLPFTYQDFKFLLRTDAKYCTQLETASNRALYIMTADSSKDKNPGWGILQSDLDADESGQLQVVLELLTAYEFLSKLLGFWSVASKTGLDYTSPTGESLDYSQGKPEEWASLKNILLNEAFTKAYPYISDTWKRNNHYANIGAENYNWEALEKEYHQEIYPQYRYGKQYLDTGVFTSTWGTSV